LIQPTTNTLTTAANRGFFIRGCHNPEIHSEGVILDTNQSSAPSDGIDRSALFLVVAVLACVLPVRTAISVNPVEALRAE
jgi:hypothetical protein